jgi:hypothetical protein
VALVIGDGREDGELLVQLRVDRHDGGHVAAAVTVVWRGPDGDDRFLREMPLFCVFICLAQAYQGKE